MSTKGNDDAGNGNLVAQQSEDLAGSLTIRKAVPEDFPAIIELLSALELDYPARDLSCFWVGETGGVLKAIAELKQLDGLSLLSCVGVREELQRTGIGRIFTSYVIAQASSDVYLYTLVPAFFKKLGFIPVSTIPSELPPRSYYGCVGCEKLGCICMVKVRDASRLSDV